ncbi:MAG: hypothetical protein LUD73_06160 [Lachnospiraceae bacterium]|nr:hypothetical protein [Lachnospiraceae bacterium]
MAGKDNTQKKQGNEQKGVHISEQIEQMKYGFDLENMWIGNADNKVIIIENSIFFSAKHEDECGKSH